MAIILPIALALGCSALAFSAGRYAEARRAARVLRGDIRPINPFRHNPTDWS